MAIIRMSILLSLIFFVSPTSSAKACGVRKSLSRIVGGRDSGGYHYPWFALLVLKEYEDFPVCAGSLITTRHILTAAHCFTIDPSTPKENLFTVLMGVYDRCNRKEPDRQAFGVAKVDVHEEYLAGEKFHDIALMTLDRPADYMVICLPYGMRDVTEPALLIGFGVTKEGGKKAPCHMMEAHITKYSKKDCKRTELPEEDTAESSVICAGKIRGGVDSCQGDSGGPLQTFRKDGQLILAGIVSFGYGCANPGLPGLYTDVASYLGWIESKTSMRDTTVKSVRNTNNGSVFEKRHGSSGSHISSPGVIPHSGHTVRFPSDDSSKSSTKPENIEWNTTKSSTVHFPNNRK